MAQIIPVKDLKDTNKVIELCNSTNEPIYITVNGYGKAVIMSMQAYEENIAKSQIYLETVKGMNDDSEGVDAKLFMQGLKEKYGI